MFNTCLPKAQNKHSKHDCLCTLNDLRIMQSAICATVLVKTSDSNHKLTEHILNVSRHS